MKLYDELYFEIILRGKKSDLRKYVQYLKSGELDDVCEVTSELINYDDGYAACADDADSEIVFTNDDIGIEIESLKAEDFAEMICNGAAHLDVTGHLYDADNEEYNFESPIGETDFFDPRKNKRFNDELDDEAYAEEEEEED